MELKDIISVPGMPGLYRVIGNNKSGFIVESLQDGKRSMVSGAQRIMSLVDVAIYTSAEEKPLREVLKSMEERDGANLPVDAKADDAKLRSYFSGIVPDYDAERVYVSDIKKVLNWYKLLQGKVDFSKSNDEGSVVAKEDQAKPVQKVHEAHGPKTEGAKAAATRSRKKV
jgi:hypothetical protein